MSVSTNNQEPKKSVSKNTRTKNKQIVQQSTLKIALLSGLGVVLLLLANSAFWVNKVIFNTENFSQITTTSLLSQSSRDAISAEIVDQALADRPVIKNAIQEPATKFISGLLATSQVETGLQKVSSKLQIILTSQQKENVEIDLTGVKQTAAKLIDLAGKEGDTTNSDKLPDRVTLVDVSQIPDFYKLGTLFMWLGPVTLIGGLLLLAYPHIRDKKVKLDLLIPQGLIVIAGWLIGLMLGPLFRPPALSQFGNINLRTVAENLYNSFVASFNSQIQTLLILGLIMIATPLIVRAYNYFRRIRSR